MAKFSFINEVLEFETDRLYVLSEYDDKDPYRYSITYADKDMLLSRIENPEVQTDYSLSQGFLAWEGETKSFSGNLIESLRGHSVDIVQGDPRNVCNFITKLVEMSACYVSKEAFDKYTESGKLDIEGTSLFVNTKVSESTMRLYLSIHGEDGWRSHSLVRYNGTEINVRDFYFAVEKDKLDGDLVGYEVLGEFVQKGRTMVMCQTDSLTVTPSFDPMFIMPSSMINYKMFVSKQLKFGMDFLSALRDTVKKTVTEDTAEEEKDEEKEAEPRVYRETNRDGVFFEQKKITLTVESLTRLYTILFRTTEMMRKGEMIKENLPQHFTNQDLSSPEKYAMSLALNIMVKEDLNPLDRIQTLSRIINMLQSMRLNILLEMFVFRSYLFETHCEDLGVLEDLLLSGGLGEEKVFVVRRGTYGSGQSTEIKRSVEFEGK